MPDHWGRAGMRSPTSKLTDEQVYAIRRRWDAGERKFHADYGISHDRIRQIGTRKAWYHLPEEKID